MERKIVEEIILFNSQLNNLERFYPREKAQEKNLLNKAINSNIKRLEIINNSIPAILNAISHFRKLKEEEERKVEGLIKVSYAPQIKGQRVSVVIEEKQKEKFLKQLKLSKDTLKRLKIPEKKIRKFLEFRKPSWYAKISNKLFLKYSNKYFEKGKLDRLNSNLRKSNMPFLVTTYLSITLFSTLLAFILGVIIFIILLIFSKLTVLNVIRNFLILFALPLITSFSLYFYPYAERKSIENKIDYELPFVAIHMSAIAGSGIEPTQIFKIIALGEEYSNTKKEFRKIVNQVNVYGYDLITALKNTARETSSRKLSELLNGMATAISSGGSLPEFLDKRAETLLFEYRLEKEKKTKSAEVFMDIYISIVIAAPMILTLLLVLLSVSGISIGLTLNQLTIVIIGIVALINMLFLIFLRLGQQNI